MSHASGRRSVQILAEVRRSIDAFLDPSVLSWASREAKDGAAAQGGQASGDAGAGEGRAQPPGELRVELLALQAKNESMQAELEDARCEARAQLGEWERRAGRDAAAIARLTQERDELKQESGSKKRRLSEVESRLVQSGNEKRAMERESEESIQGYRQQLDSLAKGAREEREQLQAEVSELKQKLAAAQAAAAAAAGGPPGTAGTAADADVLRKRVAELEHEAGALRLALEQARPDGELAAQLRKRHAEYEEELRSARQVNEELVAARSKLLKSEQEAAGLRAAVAERDARLREAEEAALGARLAQRDLEAFAVTAHAIIEEAAALGQLGEAAPPGAQERVAAVPTPLELSLAWTRFRAMAQDLRRKGAELQQRVDSAAQQEQEAQAELRRFRGDLAEEQARAKELQVAARRAEDDRDAQVARVAVLREVISRGGGEAKEPPAPGPQPEIEAARKQAAILEDVVKAKNVAIVKLRDELATLRKDAGRLSEVEARALRLERVNAELWGSNRELQARQERLAAEVGAGPGDAAAGDAIAGGGFDAAAIVPSVGGMSSSLLLEDAGGAGLQRADLALELGRHRRAVRKYVQEFREGLYGLLGWKVEMRVEGGAALWHLTSRFSKGRTLAFQLRPAEAGRPAQFDLLATPWGEELHGDRQAMAYLEVYGSIPGFLAHVTAGLLKHEKVQR